MCTQETIATEMEVENNVHGPSEDSEADVLVVNPPSSTAEYHRWPTSGLGEHLPSEAEKPGSWKEKLHFKFIVSRFQDRATELKAWLQQLKWKKILEVVSVSCIILLVWIVFTIPAIVFAVTPATKNEVSVGGENNASLNLNASVPLAQECSQRAKYEGEVCTEELTQWQLCFLGPQESSDIYLPSSNNQQEAEAMARQLLSSFRLLSPSSECMGAFRPFLCLELFRSCDAENRLRQVTRPDCVRLTTDVCSREFNIARNFLGEGVLPSCDSFQDQEIQCLADVSPSFPDQQTRNAIPNITCAEGFYLSNSSVCSPLCSSWVEPSPGNPFQGIIIASLVIGFLSSLFVIVISLTLQRSEMLSFPKYFIIYFCITVNFVALIILIGVSNKEELFCSSNDFLESFVTETPFCSFSGITYTYGLSQAGCWILILTLVIFWGIYFPFHYQRFKASGRFKRVHITAVVLAVALPAIPALALLGDGYHISDIPICTARSLNTVFFVFILPFSILSGVIVTLLVLIFWSILKQFIRKTLSKGLKKARDVGKADAKILFLTTAYILTSSLVLITFTYVVVVRERDIQVIGDYFFCQSMGTQPDRQCGATSSFQSTALKSLLKLAIILEGLVPISALVFVAKCNCNYKFKKMIDQ